MTSNQPDRLPPEAVLILEEWLEQVGRDPVVCQLVVAAIRSGRGIQVVLRMNSRGKVLSPKATVGE